MTCTEPSGHQCPLAGAHKHTHTYTVWANHEKEDNPAFCFLQLWMHFEGPVLSPTEKDQYCRFSHVWKPQHPNS